MRYILQTVNKKASIATLISENKGHKDRVLQEKKGLYITIKTTIFQEDLTTLDMYTSIT